VTVPSGVDDPEPTGSRLPLRPTRIERICDWCCRAAIMIIVALVVVEILCRSLLGFSLQMSDEVGGYALVGIAFMSPGICNAKGGFHRVEFIRQRLSERGQLRLDVVMQLLCLLFAVVLAWQLGRLEITTYLRNDVADTVLGTPLWLPRMTMPLGMMVLCISLTRSVLADLRALRVRPSRIAHG
jgi:TRAP-type C4-dicarboxylate transport system permease small subunit